MTTATKYLLTATKAPDAKGTFEGVIDANPPDGDFDNERVASWENIPGEFPLVYSHTYSDPGAEIGTVMVMEKGDDRHLLVFGRLDLSSPMGRAVHERMLLPSDDPMALKELSVGFAFDTAKVKKDQNGVDAIEGAVLVEVSVVHRGAEQTAVTNVKRTRPDLDAELARKGVDSEILAIVFPAPAQRKAAEPEAGDLITYGADW